MGIRFKASVRRSRTALSNASRPAAEGPLPNRTLSPSDVARAIVAQIVHRSRFLELATEDPQWLMALELFIAAQEGSDISVSTLCMISGVPPTTALRHMRSLEAKGIFERAPHPKDGRVSLIRLSADAHRRVGDYLDSIVHGDREDAGNEDSDRALAATM
jgi:DNA-binding transcriptional ArsR family regulator